MSVDRELEKFDAVTLSDAMKEVELMEGRGEEQLLEFQRMGRCEPSHFHGEVWRSQAAIPKRKFEEFQQIAERPSISKEVYSQMHKKFKEAGREDEIKCLLEVAYDPIAVYGELHNFEEQVFGNFKEIHMLFKVMHLSFNVIRRFPNVIHMISM